MAQRRCSTVTWKSASAVKGCRAPCPPGSPPTRPSAQELSLERPKKRARNSSSARSPTSQVGRMASSAAAISAPPPRLGSADDPRWRSRDRAWVGVGADQARPLGPRRPPPDRPVPGWWTRRRPIVLAEAEVAAFVGHHTDRGPARDQVATTSTPHHVLANTPPPSRPRHEPQPLRTRSPGGRRPPRPRVGHAQVASGEEHLQGRPRRPPGCQKIWAWWSAPGGQIERPHAVVAQRGDEALAVGGVERLVGQLRVMPVGACRSGSPRPPRTRRRTTDLGEEVDPRRAGAARRRRVGVGHVRPGPWATGTRGRSGRGGS